MKQALQPWIDFYWYCLQWPQAYQQARRIRWRDRNEWDLIHEYMYGSAIFVIIALGFIGMILVHIGCFQAKQLMGDMSIVGPGLLQIILRELGPILTAFMLTKKVGASMSAEIASMRATDQIDALQMSGVSALAYLGPPRLMASFLSMIVLTWIGAMAMFLCGALVAQYQYQLEAASYLSTHMLKPIDLIMFIHKSASFGFIIPVVSIFCGLRAKKSAQGVGQATMHAVVYSSLAVAYCDIALSAFYTLLWSSS